MSSINNYQSVGAQSNAQLHSDLVALRSDASKTLQDYLQHLGTIMGESNLPSGAPQLKPPSESVMSAADLTLRIALLQDAIDQLNQQVSKLEIDGRLNELQKNNADQLEDIKKQIKEAQEAIRKQEEAAKKAGIFGAIANWFKCIFDFVCAIVNVFAAAAYALTGNLAAAAGLVVSAAALAASGVCNFVLAIDATHQAIHGKGLLSDSVKADLNKAAEICGYIAMAAGMLSGLAVITQAVRGAVATATKELINAGYRATTKEIAQQVVSAMKEAVKEMGREAFHLSTKSVSKEASRAFADQAVKVAFREGTKAASDVAEQAVQQAITAAIKQAIKQAYGPLFDAIARMGLATAIGKGVGATVDAVGTLEVAKIEKLVAEHQRKADEAEASAKAFQAMIAMLRNMIEQLQQELAEMIESSMNAVQAVFNAADEASSSIKELFNARPN
jgi:hypothetical protein